MAGKKMKHEWKNKFERQTYFNNLNERVIRLQYAILQKMLDENPLLAEEFIRRWKKKNITLYALAQDPEYSKWLKEGEKERRIELPLEDGEKPLEKPVVIIKTRPEQKPILPKKTE